jgi:hypothetical protein
MIDIQKVKKVKQGRSAIKIKIRKKLKHRIGHYLFILEKKYAISKGAFIELKGIIQAIKAQRL